MSVEISVAGGAGGGWGIRTWEMGEARRGCEEAHSPPSLGIHVVGIPSLLMRSHTSPGHGLKSHCKTVSVQHLELSVTSNCNSVIICALCVSKFYL